MEITEIKNIRLEKLSALKAKGLNPYGQRFDPTIRVAQALAQFEENKKVAMAGRIVANRKHGKLFLLIYWIRRGRSSSI